MKLLVIGSGMKGSAQEPDVPADLCLGEIEKRGIRIEYAME